MLLFLLCCKEAGAAGGREGRRGWSKRAASVEEEEPLFCCFVGVMTHVACPPALPPPSSPFPLATSSTAYMSPSVSWGRLECLALSLVSVLCLRGYVDSCERPYRYALACFVAATSGRAEQASPCGLPLPYGLSCGLLYGLSLLVIRVVMRFTVRLVLRLATRLECASWGFVRLAKGFHRPMCSGGGGGWEGGRGRGERLSQYETHGLLVDGLCCVFGTQFCVVHDRGQKINLEVAYCSRGGCFCRRLAVVFLAWCVGGTLLKNVALLCSRMTIEVGFDVFAYFFCFLGARRGGRRCVGGGGYARSP